jgi:hypothetical protein
MVHDPRCVERCQRHLAGLDAIVVTDGAVFPDDRRLCVDREGRQLRSGGLVFIGSKRQAAQRQPVTRGAEPQ